MNAREVTTALGGRWYGSHGMACCPAHQDRTPSLSIRQGQDGRLLTYCHAGCDADAVWAAIRGVTGSVSEPVKGGAEKGSPFPDAAERSKAARKVWRESKPIMGTLVEVYLRHRGIATLTWPALRYHPGLKHPDIGQQPPVLVAAVSGPDHRITAIQRTWLRQDGKGKAPVARPKMALGPLHDGAVRLAAAGPALGLAEGIETALSAMQLFQIPVWAVIGTRFDRVAIPPQVRELHIFADNGQPGQDAARNGTKAHRDRRVIIRNPPPQFSDWNEALCVKRAVA